MTGRCAGRSATAGPSTTRCTIRTRATIYASAASEWHGAGVWRTRDLGETWELSSEGIGYPEGELKLSRVAGLAAAHGKVLRRRRGGRRVRERRRRRHLVASQHARRPARARRLERSRQAAARPSGDDGDPAASRRSRPLHDHRPGLRDLRDDATAAVRGTPCNTGLRAEWPLEDDRVGYCVHKLVMSPADHSRFYQQNHCGMHRSDDGGHSWTEITDGLPTDFGFVAAAHPHDRDSFYVIPLDPGHGRCMPDGAAAVWRTSDAGSTWRRLDRGLPQRTPTSASCARAWRSTRSTQPGLYFGTSTGQVFASADEGETWNEIASYLPGISSVEVAVDRMPWPTSTSRHAAAALHRPAAPARRRRRHGRRGDRAPGGALARPARPAVRAGPDPPPPHQRLRRPRAGRARHGARAGLAGRRDRGDQRRLIGAT